MSVVRIVLGVAAVLLGLGGGMLRAQPAPAPGAVVLPQLASGAEVAVIPIDGMIYDWTMQSLERRVQRAVDAGADVIVIRLNTPGGVVTSAIDICKFIKALPVPTVAWVDDQAYSAGTLIASACDAIVMAPGATFGDSAPVMLVGELAPTERAKALSPLLAEYRDNAANNGYDYPVFHAMCVLGVELFLVERAGGAGGAGGGGGGGGGAERRVVNAVDYAVMVRGLDPAEADAEAQIADSPDAELARVAAPTREQSDLADVGAWTPVTLLPSGRRAPDGRIHDGTTLYTPSTTEALDIGLAAAEVADPAALQNTLRGSRVIDVPQTWSETLAGFAHFLTHPLARAVLVVIVMVGGYLELQAPGLSVPGGLALLALAALLGAPFVVGLAEWWHIAVFIIGLVLLGVEILLTPTFGVLGVVGLLMMLAGLVFSVVPSTGGGALPLPAAGSYRVALNAAALLMAGVLVGLAGMVAITVHFGRIPGLSRMILGDEPAQAAAGGPAGVESHALVGATGAVTVPLRPTGRVEIDGEVLDVVSTGRFVEPGTAVRVVEVAGNRIVVEPV